MRVGFVGIGTMGRHMAANLQAGGHDLVVHDVRPAIYIFTCVHQDRETAIEYAVARLGATYAQDFRTKAGRYTLVGTPADCRARLAEYVDAGARTVFFASACPDEHVVENQRLLVEEIIPTFR